MSAPYRADAIPREGNVTSIFFDEVDGGLDARQADGVALTAVGFDGSVGVGDEFVRSRIRLCCMLQQQTYYVGGGNNSR